jgi:hypothetical protein
MTLRRLIASGAGVAALVATSVPYARADPADDCIAAAEQSQPLRRDGKLKAARGRLAVCARPECPAVVRADCAKWLADVEALMPSIVVRAVDTAGADVVGVRVFVDGEQQEARLEGKEMEVDPGAHTLRVEHDGSAPIEQQIVIRESERHRILSVSFAPAAPAAPLPKAVDADAAAPSESRSIVLPVALLGAGGVALGVASYFWASGLADRSTMASGCALTHVCPQSQIDASRNKLIAGDGIGITGVLAAGVGAGILIFGGSGTPRDAPAPERPRVSSLALEPLSGGAQLQVGGRF